MFEYIKTTLMENQFASGGITVVLMSSLMYLIRSIPLRVLNFLKRRLLITDEFNSIDNFYIELNQWIYSLKKKWNNNIVISDISKVAYYRPIVDTDDEQLAFVPGYGTHLVRFGLFKYLLINKTKEKKENVAEEVSIINITYFIWNRKEINRKLHSIYKNKRVKIKNTILYNYGAEFMQSNNKQERKIETVITKYNDLLINDITNFIDNKENYTNKGIPYRRGYLLYGPPGNGKSSLVLAISQRFQKDIFIVNLTDKELDDSRLFRLFGQLKENSIVLLEDIDCIFENRENKINNLSMSGLLNAIDGISSRPNGTILFMTTNHIDKLDDALIRPGRIDKKLHLNNSDRELASNLLKLYNLPQDEDWLEWANGKSMATLQENLINFNKDELIWQR